MNNTIDKNKSIAIFNELIKGKIINQKYYELNKKEFIDNQLFIEIRNNFKDYSMLYEMQGFKIIDNKDHFYLELDQDDNDENTKIDKRMNKTILIIGLIVIGRYITKHLSLSFDLMINPTYGFSLKELDSMNTIDDINSILKNINKNIKSIMELLIDKNLIILCKDDKNFNDRKYILSESGVSLFTNIVKEYDNK